MCMKISFPGGKKVDAEYKGFTIKTDQPEYEGGNGSAPEPFSLFVASIGTCTGVYVLGFCQKRKIPTEDIKLVLKTDKDKETHMINKINIEIQVPENFPESYNNAVIKSAELCSVKKHLEKPPKIDIYIKNGR